MATSENSNEDYIILYPSPTVPASARVKENRGGPSGPSVSVWDVQPGELAVAPFGSSRRPSVDSLVASVLQKGLRDGSLETPKRSGTEQAGPYIYILYIYLSTQP